MRKAYSRIWNMAKKKKNEKKSENGELQKRTLQDLRYGNKH